MITYTRFMYIQPFHTKPEQITLLQQQGRAETFGGAGAQSIKGAHGTWLLIGLLRPFLRLSRGKVVTLRLWQICKMEAARNNARTQTANESDLLYKVKKIHITTKYIYKSISHLKRQPICTNIYNSGKKGKENLNESTQEKEDASDAKRKKETKPILPHLNL